MNQEIRTEVVLVFLECTLCILTKHLLINFGTTTNTHINTHNTCGLYRRSYMCGAHSGVFLCVHVCVNIFMVATILFPNK